MKTLQEQAAGMAEQISEDYAALVTATQAVYESDAQVMVARAALASARQRVILDHADDPNALGANEAAREARIAEMTTTERGDLDAAGAINRSLRHNHALAALAVERNRAIVRCLEVSASAMAGGR